MEIYLVWYYPAYSDDPAEIMDAFTNLSSAEQYVEAHKYQMPLRIEKLFVKNHFSS